MTFPFLQAGDASTYLRPDRSGKLQMDTDFYLGSRGMLGDGPALSNFLNELVQSQLFEKFVDSRKGQVQSGRERAVSPRGGDGVNGPFLRCVEVLKQKAETFSVSNIKKVLKAQQQANGESETSGRWTTLHDAASQLTSNSATTSDAQRALMAVVEDSFSSIYLPSIFRVIWNRLGDCKGLKWRHAHKSLILLREILIRGPESILSEVLSNIWVLRTFLEYKPGMGGQGQKVRDTAKELFFLVLNGRRFMLLRTIYWVGNKKLAPPRIRLGLEHALSTSFADLHRVVTPSADAPVPTPGRGGAPTPDLLSDAAADFVTVGDMSAFVSEPDEAGVAEDAGENALLRHGSSSSHNEGPNSARSQGGAKAAWESFNSGSGVAPEAAAPPQQQWETFHGPVAGAPSAANPQWERFEGSGAFSPAPAKPDRRTSTATVRMMPFLYLIFCWWGTDGCIVMSNVLLYKAGPAPDSSLNSAFNFTSTSSSSTSSILHATYPGHPSPRP